MSVSYVRRFAGGAIAALLAATVLAACGSNASSDDDAGSSGPWSFTSGDGKTVKTFRNKSGEGKRFVLKVNPARYGKGIHRLKARVVYNAASRTKPRTLQMSFERCVKQVIKPQFTG